MDPNPIVVIGGGAAGLMAAGQAASCGASVLVLERMAGPGRKLLLTGNGRCNLTRAGLDAGEFLERYNREGAFLRQALHELTPYDLVSLIEGAGVPCRTEPDGRVFPASGRAADVLDALLNLARTNGARIATDARAQRLIVREGRVCGVQMERPLDGRTEWNVAAVILATGGASYPQTGSTGDGYAMAEAAGHRIVPIRGALVPVETEGEFAQELQGLTLEGVDVSIVVGGHRNSSDTGSLLFTHFGLSGPLILRWSRMIGDALAAGRRVEVDADVVVDVPVDGLDVRLREALAAHGRQSVRRVLREFVPDRLAVACCGRTGVDPARQAARVSAEERRRLVSLLKGLRIPVRRCRPLGEAMVTAGGVDTRDLDPRTLMSRRVTGLFFAGEVIDVDGDTGGFNLQAAFSTGWLAGRRAAEWVRRSESGIAHSVGAVSAGLRIPDP